MKRWILHLGIPLAAIGLLLLGIGFPTHLVDSNAYLLLCLLLIVGGCALRVYAAKHRSKY